ncbi:PhzF family phenazine biosynthesis protein [Natranaerobius thermophilus]|uniref:Phenazine biosynthesis protein PhzF family n=1 Tax=Natranaerobius thermophilus (strain ATCC BAA-1301 / DSM 18059 / JW/NM-WN-LF) TaxID=457570 RepID=B2A3J8_NATTJ|nr:PhzF family phenazine biosynthesis protein [Natranaerobius thermophilus]ACB86427.1 phenazine biosynthesis protein PhzF family [Natranaerobius thermophilus JW/NM-WN-LF]
MKAKFFQVDSFTETSFGGNPAGVIISEQELPRETMQNLAKEVNASETAFVLPGLEFRFFTPTVEVSYCGHATVAAFHALVTSGYLTPDQDGTTYTQTTQEGSFPVTVYPRGNGSPLICTWKHDKDIEMGDKVSPYVLEDLFYIKNSVNATFTSVNEFCPMDLPLQVINVGISDLHVPVKDVKTLQDLVPRLDRLALLSRKMDIVGLHLFTFSSPRGGDLFVRNFAPLVGIDEEAATGSANSGLAYYLAQYGAVDYGKRLLIDQGDTLGRPSRMYITPEEQGSVLVEGTGVTIFSGQVDIL